MKREKSFTLIELLVVIAILGLLSSFVLVAMRGSREKAEVAKLLQYSSSIKHVLGADVILELNFEGAEDDGVVDDSSGYDNTCSIDGNENYEDNSISELGKSFSFDGSTLIKVDNLSGLTDSVTVEFWFNPSALNNNDLLVFYEFNCSLSYLNGELVFATSKGSVVSSFSNLNEWSHIVGTFNKGETKLFINTEEKASGSFDSYSFQVANLDIGGYRWGAGYEIDGKMDNLRIYSKALSSAEIKKHYVEKAKEKGIAVK